MSGATFQFGILSPPNGWYYQMPPEHGGALLHGATKDMPAVEQVEGMRVGLVDLRDPFVLCFPDFHFMYLISMSGTDCDAGVSRMLFHFRQCASKRLYVKFPSMESRYPHLAQ